MDDLELGRELGSINARLTTHDATFTRIEKAQADGFSSISRKLDGLIAERNRRRGILGAVKLGIGSGVLASIAELFRRHHG